MIMKPLTRALMLSALAAAALAAGIAAWSWQRLARHVFTDGVDLRVPTEMARLRNILWQPPTPLSEQINTVAQEYEPRLSADGLTLYFVRGKPGENADIFTCHRTTHGWSEPQPLTDINTESDELGPEITSDGTELYFCSNRPGGIGGYDLWRSIRTDNGWGPAESLGNGINTGWNENNPAIAPDGTTLFFASNQPRPEEAAREADLKNQWSATVRDNSRVHDFDLYSAPIVGSDIGQPNALISINTADNEGTPAMSPAGDFLYFSSDRTTGMGRFDLYRTRHLRGEWLAAENLGPQINTTANELDPALSMGGFALQFSSDRGVELPEQSARGQYDLYASVSKEMFEERESTAETINWASLLATVLPNLLWLLLGLLLVFLLLRFIRSGRMKALSLLARCLLLSLFAHILLMMLFMIWGVTVGLADAIKRGGSVQVGLTSSSIGQYQGIVSQIRGGMTVVQMTPLQMTSERQQIQSTTDETVVVGVRVPDQSHPVQVADHVPVPAAEANEAPAPSDRMALSMMTEVPVELVQSITTRVPSPSTAAPVKEADSSAPLADVQSLRRAETTTLETSRNASVQSAVARLPESALHDFFSQDSMIGSPNAQEAAPASESPAMTLSAISVPTSSSNASVSLPRADRGSASTTTEAQPTITGTAKESGRAERNTAIDAPTSVSSETVHITTLMGVNVDAAPSSLMQSSASGVADAAPPATSVSEQASSTIGVPSLAMSATMPDLRTPSDSSGSGSRIAVNEAQPEFGAGGGGPHGLGKIDSVPAMEVAAGSAVHATVETTGLAGKIDESSLALNGTNNAITDAAWPSSMGMTGLNSNTALIPALPQGDVGLRMPTETAPPVEAYRQRAAENRLELVKEMGGSEATERAVELALKWLAAHQSADGRWDADYFDDDCGRCGSPAKYDADVATTGLALLCFLAANHTHNKDGPYRDNVQRGLDWLVAQQKATGDMRGNETMYSHGIGSIALSEAYGMTRDETLLPHVRRAINFIVSARDNSGRDGSPSSGGGAGGGAGGWRYEPGQAGDTSVLGWQVMALVSASRAGIEVPDETLQAARHWLDRVSHSSNPGLYAYQPGVRFSAAMTAEGMFSQQLLGRRRDEPRMQGSAEFIIRNLPNWRVEPNTYYWYYATLALFQHQGEAWEKWNAAITRQLLDNQNTNGAKAGSWDPLDRWSKIGGRIYQTAMCTLCLEVYYRYLPLYGSHADND